MNHEEFIQFWKQMKPVASELDERFAELTSSCPDLSLRFSTPDGRSYNYLCYVILIKLYAPLKTEYFKSIYFEHVQRTARTNQFSGKWKLIEEILTKPIFTEEKMFYLLRKHFSKEDIFGNLVPALRRCSKAIHIRKFKDNRPVRKPRRKRGYDDKGSLLLPHQKHSAWTFKGPNPEKEPLEDIFYPLTSREWINGTKESGGSGGNNAHPTKKEDDQFEKSSNSTSDPSNRGQNRKTSTSEELPRKFSLSRPSELEASFFSFVTKNRNLETKFHTWELYLYKLMMSGKEIDKGFGKYPKRLRDLRKNLSKEEVLYLDSIDEKNLEKELELFFKKKNLHS